MDENEASAWLPTKLAESDWSARRTRCQIELRNNIEKLAMRCEIRTAAACYSNPDILSQGRLMPPEKEKMLAGELYDPLDPELVRARERARDLCWDLNATREQDQETRRSILKELIGRGGDSVWMQPPFYCDYGSNILLGERVFFNFNCVVLDVCEVTVGDFTMFGPAVQIYTATHPLNAELRRKQEFAKPIELGSDVWVGGGAILCPGVKIGSKSVIGAGSVVTRDIPGGVFAAGNPCRVLREITE
jgi:maltose O-acetyltransferase